MTFATALELLLKYGPSAVDLALKLKAAIDAGRANQPLTEADWAEMKRLSELDSKGIYSRLGITPPPPSP